MAPKKLIQTLKNAHPDDYGKLPIGNATVLLEAALAVLAEEIRSTDEGTVKVPGLGVFRIKQVSAPKGKPGGMRKRIVFRPAMQNGPSDKDAENE